LGHLVGLCLRPIFKLTRTLFHHYFNGLEMVTTVIGYLFMGGALIWAAIIINDANGPYEYDWRLGIIPAIIAATIPFAIGLALVLR